MKRRAEEEHDWTDDLWVDPQVGHGASSVQGTDAEEVAAVLWVPDPEQRRGYREYYVKRNDEKPGKRPMGFRVPDKD